MNFRLLILNADSLVKGDKVLHMGIFQGSIPYLTRPCKLQMEWLDPITKLKTWLDIPFEYDER